MPPLNPDTLTAGSVERLIWLLDLDANMLVRTFAACCQTVTAACGEIVPMGERENNGNVCLRVRVGG